MEDVIIKTYESEIDADIAKGLLESNNIKSTVFTLGSTHYGTKGGWAQLRVLEKDAERAKEILKKNQINSNATENTKKKSVNTTKAYFLLLILLILLIILAGTIVTLFKTIKL